MWRSSSRIRPKQVHSRVRHIMFENLSIMLWSVTLKKTTSCLKYAWRVAQGISPSLGYSLFSLQPGMMMQRPNEALKVATTPFNKLIYYTRSTWELKYFIFTFMEILVFFNYIILFIYAKKCSLCRHYARCSDYSIMPRIMRAECNKENVTVAISDKSS